MGGCESKDGASPSASRAAPAVQPEGRPGWWSPGLEDPECAAGLIALEGAGQQALLASFAKGKDVKKQKRLLRQAAALEKSYPGGLKVYVANAKKLLEDSAKGVNPLDGCKPSVPEGMVLYRSGDQYDQYCAKGLLEVPYCCFVIVAGGLGERLGFDGIKLSLPCETITMTCFLNLYIGYIKEWTALANEALKTPMAPQIAMMTSDDTHDKTVALLKENDYFGLGPKQITLMKQGKVPALKNGDADFATLPDDPYTILTKPHGHGDAHQLLYQHGLIKEWSAMGKRHVVFMQDTHSLVVFKLLAALGVSAEKGYAMNSITVPRKPGEESGSICTLQKDGAAALTINVEYNQLNPLLQSAFGRSDEADPATGYSPYPGNVNCFILKLEEYATVLTETKGCVPEFVNPKYADATRTTFKSPTRLECMMQDIPRFFPASALIGYVLFERSMYCPVKNACNTGAAKQAKGQQASCAVDGEHLWYANAASLLRECGADVAAHAPREDREEHQDLVAERAGDRGAGRAAERLDAGRDAGYSGAGAGGEGCGGRADSYQRWVAQGLCGGRRPCGDQDPRVQN
eukprot:TRINITY_DN2456_c0_g1_i1.p1 TRINITY_DN2456_c0_g1~~TRINITY_DN2456_c0_g1_i1.p1  ORF type:complete len:575 (+),score=157.73 TRINITY_DN2456_c0_g1_i1:57-1781(+)